MYLLVHPDYEAQAGVFCIPYLHNDQILLRKKWDDKITELTTRSDTSLLYVSSLKPDRYMADHRFPLSNRDRLEKEDVERRARYQEMLGNRFVPFPNEPFTTEGVTFALAQNGLSYDSTSLTVHPFGEYKEACVKTWGRKLAGILGVKDEHYEPLSELSLTLAAADEISEWRELRYYLIHKER